MSASVARRLAPEIDRIALSIHRPAGRRPELRAAIEGLQIPAGSIVVSAARHLAAGRVTLEDLQLLGRYESRTLVAMNAQRHVDLGFLDAIDQTTFVPSSAFRAVAELVLRVQVEVADELWSGAGRLGEAVALAEGFVGVAAQPREVGAPAFAAQVRDRPVASSSSTTSAAGRLLAACTELRYLRSDLHAHALGRHGLAGPKARIVARLWKGHPVSDEEGTSVESTGFAASSGSGWTLTPTGAAVRDAVEGETDELVAAALGPAFRVDGLRFCEALATLPGDDPRPLEDR